MDTIHLFLRHKIFQSSKCKRKLDLQFISNDSQNISNERLSSEIIRPFLFHHSSLTPNFSCSPIHHLNCGTFLSQLPITTKNSPIAANISDSIADACSFTNRHSSPWCKFSLRINNSRQRRSSAPEKNIDYPLISLRRVQSNPCTDRIKKRPIEKLKREKTQVNRMIQ